MTHVKIVMWLSKFGQCPELWCAIAMLEVQIMVWILLLASHGIC